MTTMNAHHRVNCGLPAEFMAGAAKKGRQWIGSNGACSGGRFTWLLWGVEGALRGELRARAQVGGIGHQCGGVQAPEEQNSAAGLAPEEIMWCAGLSSCCSIHRAGQVHEDRVDGHLAGIYRRWHEKRTINRFWFTTSHHHCTPTLHLRRSPSARR